MYKIGETTNWYCPKCKQGDLVLIGLNRSYATCQCDTCDYVTKIIVAYGHRKYKKHDLKELKDRFEKSIKNY